MIFVKNGERDSESQTRAILSEISVVKNKKFAIIKIANK